MKYLIITILSAVLTVSIAVAMPKTFETQEELDPATFGYPFPIFSQTLTSYEKVSFPWSTNLNSPWESPTNVLFHYLVADVALFWIVLLLIWELYTKRSSLK